MKLVIETEDHDEINDLINAAKVKGQVFEIHTTLRNYIKYSDRNAASDADMLQQIYQELSLIVYED